MKALHCSRCGSADRVRIIAIKWDDVHEDWPLCVACTKALVAYLQPIFTDVIYRSKDTAFRGSTTLGHLSDFWAAPP